MDYFKYRFSPGQGLQTEILLAMLAAYPFVGFEEEGENLSAYVPGNIDAMTFLPDLLSLAQQFPFQWEVETLPKQNWNAAWERNYSPICVGTFCYVRAAFHPPAPGFRVELQITPKMAFGTGHHETTRMMLEAMELLDFMGKKVFDFGCGTGILGILAAKLGATAVLAIDLDPIAVENSLENARLNGVSDHFTGLHTGLSGSPSGNHDVILANINRNVLLESMQGLAEKLAIGGALLLSGFLDGDVEMISEKAASHGLLRKEVRHAGSWAMAAFITSPN